MFRDLSTLMATPLRIKALAYILKRPGEEGTAAEFAAVSGTSKENALKELNALVRLGILRARGTGANRKFIADEADILFEPIRGLLVQATMPDDKEIIQAFRGVRGIWLLVAAGALTNDAHSPVDLLIVTRNPDEPKLGKAVKKIESLAAIPIRYAILEVEEYLGRRQAYDRMLRDMFEYPHRIILERGGS